MARGKTKSRKSEGSESSGSFFLNIAEKKLKFLESLTPISLIGLRLFIANIFWKSGLTKIESFETTVFLFAEEYRTHEKLTLFGMEFLTPEIAAYGSIFAELTFPILLIIGLWTRFAAFSLLIMTAVIQFTYLEHDTHLIWALMLFPLLTIGAGRASWDYFIRSTFFGFPENSGVKDKLIAITLTLGLTLYAAYVIFSDVVNIG